MPRRQTLLSSKLTSKGQTTIPQEIRKRLKLKPGDRLEYRVSSDGRIILAPAKKKGSVRELFGFLAPAPRRLTIDEINEAVAQAVAERALRR